MRKLSLSLASLLLASLVAPPAMAVTDVFTTAPDGTVTHVESGAHFPQNVAGFERTGEAIFDGSGEYIGVGYRRTLADGSPVSLKIAIIHIAGMTARDHFIIAKPMILKGLTAVQTVAEGPYVRADKGTDGYLGIFRARDGTRKIGLGLWTFDRGYWDVRGRVEFPQGKQKETQAAVDAFVDAFVGAGQPYKTPAN